MNDKESLRLLEISAFNVWVAVCAVGRKELLEEVTKPKPGDLVVEVTSIWARNADGERLGHLLRVEGEAPNEVTVIRLPDGREQRWGNAKFVKVLDRPATF